jgi:hypothetical protein
MKINWKQKLSSRKFWAMLGGQIAAILTAIGAGENQVMRVVAVVASIGTIVVYMMAEAKTDAARGKGGDDDA